MTSPPDDNTPETGWAGPYFSVRFDAFDVRFRPHPNEKLADVSNVDAEVRLPDGSRWSATIVTSAEVERLMDHWTDTGEATGGRYFWSSDALIVQDPGVVPMAKVIAGLVDTGELRQIFKQLDPPDR
ncbi:hypothetical protein ACEZCY_12440 [Streptacidiphilus sp. N1-12]|uniref:Immunity protein 53 n=2 Tax=Streptacidiphilus alkalitolerans TaxID=3342712 RepID=A0ABV6V8N1_9ACTN